MNSWARLCVLPRYLLVTVSVHEDVLVSIACGSPLWADSFSSSSGWNQEPNTNLTFPSEGGQLSQVAGDRAGKLLGLESSGEDGSHGRHAPGWHLSL